MNGLIFKNNTAKKNGGGIFIGKTIVSITSMTISESNFHYNQAGEDGGAITFMNSVRQNINITISGCKFSHNTAMKGEGRGGAVYIN